MLTVAVKAVDPLKVTELGEIEHVESGGAPVQVSDTA
jgi:hypothetical protein